MDSTNAPSIAGRDAPRYGVDAPGVIRILLAIGMIGIAVGEISIQFGRGVAFIVIGAVLTAAGSVAFTLGLAMIAYAFAGKRRVRDWILDQHVWRGDEVVLDVGAGRGFMTVGAAKRVPRGRVIAIDVWRAEDLSGNGPDALSANAPAEGVSGQIEVRTVDARALDLPDASVDVVLSLLCLHNIEPATERARALREIARVLKSGGRALIADYTATASYAIAFRDAGLRVRGPINGMRVALSLMALVEAQKTAA
jgi:SAM-dependent methyltransferase